MADVLVVEDEGVLRRSLTQALRTSGHYVRAVEGGKDAVAEVETEAPDVVLLDGQLPDAIGLDVLSEILTLNPNVRVLMMTAFGSVSEAVEAMRRGAVDYLQKPLDMDEVRLQIERWVSAGHRERELSYLRERESVISTGVIGSHPSLTQLFGQVARLAEAQLPPSERPAVLLTGETGTGKGLLARAIHTQLGGGPFIEVNCTALPASLVEAELFGHERGTFTDAKGSRPGLFEAASGGAVFLDEIGHIEPALQAKFLKVIEEKRVRRLGATRDRPIDVHVIAATNRDLEDAVASGDFREDLYHRLRVLAFDIPPLREREVDIDLLVDHFAAELGVRYRKNVRVTDAARERLRAHSWPGNVRELQHLIERAVLLTETEELGSAVIDRLLGGANPAVDPAERFELPSEGVALDDVERQLIVQALARTNGNRTQAAKLLGVSRDALRYRIEKFEIDS